MNGRKRRSLLLGAAFVSGLALWTASVVLLGVSEPWDSPRYWIACLAALFLSALFGCLIGRRAWVAGVLVVCAQLPVMLVQRVPVR